MTSGAGSWLSGYLPGLRRLAAGLVGRSQLDADALIVAALLARRSAWPQLRTLDYPEAELRAIVVGHAIRGRRAHAPEPASWPRTGGLLDVLSATERAVVVLRFAESLTQAEISAVVDQPIPAVQALLEHALARIAAARTTAGDPPRSAETVVRTELAALAAVADQTDSGPLLRQLDAEVRRRARLRRRTAALSSAALLAAALLALVPSYILSRRPPPNREPGDWIMIHQVRPPHGVIVTDRGMTATSEWTNLHSRSGSDDPYRDCTVTIHLAGSFDPGPTAPYRQRAYFHGRRAFFESGIEGRVSSFSWEYARDGWGVASCTLPLGLDKSLLIALADGVLFRPSPLVLPFAVDSLPAGYRIDSVSEGVNVVTAEVILTKAHPAPGDGDLSLYFSPFGGPNASDCPVIQIQGRAAFVDPAPEHSRLCLQDEPYYVCIAAFPPTGDWPADTPEPINMRPLLVSVAETVRLAPDLVDRSTWFPTLAALPAR
jgi:hypothetical protein